MYLLHVILYQIQVILKYILLDVQRIRINVVIKFIAPNNDDIDVKCNENIAISTDGPLCDCIPDNGGYTVHPVPAPFSINALDIKHINAGGKSQKLILFKRANDISLAPIINGTK